MPELPEVETVARGLRYLAGKSLGALEILDAKVWFESELSPEKLSGLKLLEISRRGKYILLRFERNDLHPHSIHSNIHNRIYTLVQHLRMTGKMLEAASPNVPEHIRDAVPTRKGKGLQVRCRFVFADAELWFYDTRRFGTLTLVSDEEKFFLKKKIAPDPFHDPDRALPWFVEHMQKCGKPAKAALLDQAIVAGVGNIYADEVLFRCGIHPLTPANKIADLFGLWKEILRMLERSIELGGSTIRDYVSASGEAGTFAQEHNVYGREGEPCAVCGSQIRRIVVAGRSTHFCLKCQPKKKPGAAKKKRKPGGKKRAR